MYSQLNKVKFMTLIIRIFKTHKAGWLCWSQTHKHTQRTQRPPQKASLRNVQTKFFEIGRKRERDKIVDFIVHWQTWGLDCREDGALVPPQPAEGDSPAGLQPQNGLARRRGHQGSFARFASVNHSDLILPSCGVARSTQFWCLLQYISDMFLDLPAYDTYVARLLCPNLNTTLKDVKET